MSDDQPPDDEPEVDRTAASRRSAQSAASDLARMGIDPRSLGLDDSASPPQRPAADDARVVSARHEDPTARIVPLRPEFAAEPVAPTIESAPAVAGPVERPRGLVEQLLARTASRKPAPRSPSRIVRAVTLGLVTPDAAEAAGNEREIVAALRHRQTERRIVTFVAGKGGVGTTSVAFGVGAAFAALREDHSVLIDAQPGTSSLGRLHHVAEPVSARSLLASAQAPTPAVTSAGLAVVDGVGWEQPLQRRDLVTLLERLGGEHTFNLIDVGDDAGEATHAALARSDQSVIVTCVGEVGMIALEAAIARVRQVNPLAAEQAVYVVVCQHHDSYRRAHREVTSRLAIAPARVVVVPPDETLQAGQPFDPALVSAATREAILEIAAAIALSGGNQ